LLRRAFEPACNRALHRGDEIRIHAGELLAAVLADLLVARLSRCAFGSAIRLLATDSAVAIVMPKIIVQTETATETFPGAIAEGNYEFDGDKVTVTDLQGRPIGKEEVKAGDDPVVIAKRILRRGRSRSDFYRPLPVRNVQY
jgi:hypothetical protein